MMPQPSLASNNFIGSEEDDVPEWDDIAELLSVMDFQRSMTRILPIEYQRSSLVSSGKMVSDL